MQVRTKDFLPRLALRYNLKHIWRVVGWKDCRESLVLLLHLKFASMSARPSSISTLHVFPIGGFIYSVFVATISESDCEWPTTN